MFNLNTDSLTAQRNARVSSMLESLVAITANDLHSGAVIRDVALPALYRIVTATLPNTGKGHADQVKAMVDQAIDAALDALTAEDDTESETAFEDADKDAAKSKAA